MEPKSIIETARDAAYAMLSSMELGDAIYIYSDGRVEMGRDGCQPSNTLCLTTYAGPDDDDYLTRDEVEHRIREWINEVVA